MPSGLNQPSSEIEPIVGIQFGIFSPEEIERRSVVEITNAGTFDGSEPRIGGLFDPRMGVLDNGKTCRSCGQTNHNCPGHFGHYKLARPVYFIQFFPMIMNIMNCICIRCSKLLIDKELNKNILKKKGEARWRAVQALCANIKRCGQDTEDGCGALKPSRYVREAIARIVAEWDNIDSTPDAKKQRQVLECEYVLRLFRKITDEDVDFMGFSRYWCRPDWMICSILPIPPPQVRPSVIQDNNQRSEDDLTHKLFEIIQTNNTVQDKINNNAAKNIIDDQYAVLQYHVATLVDNQIPGVAPSAQRSGRPLKSIQQRLGSKEGRIRYNIQGKRVEFSGRSVITPDPNISIEEIGVPIKIAMNLTVPERVTTYNRNKMYKLIQNGADTYPGAKTIIRKDGRMISLKHVNTKEIVLQLGDVVNRHLMDGDPILFNRQPTLHRMSMMGHKVKVLPYNTFRLNVSVVTPYNADFDGDEMNMHCPQSYEASIELAEIAAVSKQIITPRHAKPVIGIVQDTLIGSYRITQPNVEFTRREFMNMMMWNMHFNGHVPEPIIKNNKVERFNGHQVLSQILPALNMEMGNSRYDDEGVPENFVKIHEGTVLQGIFDKDVFSKPSKGIIHTTFKDYGPKETVHFIDCMQNTIEQFLIYNGFSVGISDLIADENTKNDMNNKIRDRKAEVENIILQLHLDLFTNNTGKTNKQEFEDRVFSALNKATEESGKIGLASLAAENRLVSMVRAGSKGSTINIAQMLACVGQQAPEGRRIPLGFNDRTLPHYKKYDDGAEARGFVESSFIKGLSPQEFFFHAMSGREGLIDTAVKSVTGDTPIIIIENGEAKRVEIGPWIDAQLKSAPKGSVEQYDASQANLELLNITNDVTIPTVDTHGNMSWGKITAVTRHDPGEKIYEIKTYGGRDVIVSAGKSLLVYDSKTMTFGPKPTPEVKIGDYVPTTVKLPAPSVIQTQVHLSKYLPKDKYVYGNDFINAHNLMNEAMGTERIQIPRGWWDEHNGKEFTLPYPSKARFQRTLVRSELSKIESGYVYPFHASREVSKTSEVFDLNNENGIFLGLFLAEGNVDVKSGYVQITNNDVNIREFTKAWFTKNGISTSEDIRKVNNGTSSCIRGYSSIFAQFLDAFVGHGAEHKYVPSEAFVASEEFIIGILNGYFSGDGSISLNDIRSSSASKRLTIGISLLCNRLGIFGRMTSHQQKKNNFGTLNILPTYRFDIRSKWASLFALKVPMIHDEKQKKLNDISTSLEHRNFPAQNDVVLDAITEINEMSPDKYFKLYDLTIPGNFTFMIENGHNCYDTADTGYIQRQLVKAMEDCVTQNDGTVRDAKMNIVQFHYGEDGTNSTMIESQSLALGKFSIDEIKKEYGMVGLKLEDMMDVPRGEDTQAIDDYVKQVLNDQKIMVENVNKFKGVENSSAVYSPVNIERAMKNIKTSFKLDAKNKTDLTPLHVLAGIDKVIKKTQPYHNIWAALLRFHLAPHKLIGRDRYTVKAFDTLCEVLVVKNYQSWAQPGEQVGIIAAQSIGEPSTQMSTSYDTIIVINGKTEKIVGKIGAFIDGLLEQGGDKVVNIGNDSVVLDLTDDYNIVGVSNDEKTSWRRISQVSRHPANGGLVEITTKSGRKTTATLSHSFLTRSTTGVVPILGSELKVGTRVPIARSIPEVPNPLMEITEGTTFKLTKEFGWLCGIYLADGSLHGNNVSICKVHPRVEEKLREIATIYNWEVTIRNYQGEYGQSKSTIIHSTDLMNFLNKHFSTGSYGKTVAGAIYHSNNAFISGLLGGYFDGDGNINVERQQIRVGSRSKDLIHHIARLLAYAGIFGAFGEETSVRIPDKILYTYQVLKKFAAQFKEVIGLELAEKAAGLDAIITYMERDGKHDTKELYDKIPEVGDVIAETGKLIGMPGHSRNYGRWAKKESVGRLTLQGYIQDFEEYNSKDPQVIRNIAILRAAAYCDVLWDEITELKYLDDPKTYVYDFTVPGNDSFMVDDNILIHNTLNSVDWDTEVIIAKNGKIWTPQIGEFIDDYYDGLPENSTKVQHLANNQVYIELDDGNDWKALSTDEDGNMMWTQLEAITRHPVVNEDGSNTILEVELESGRTIKATKAKSFLIRSEDKIIDINGSDLKIGDEIPIANTLSIASIGMIKEINLREMLPPTEWLYGSEVEKALEQMNGNDRHWFQKNQGTLFTVPYNRSDTFRDAMSGRNTNTFKAGCVYPKRTRPDISHIPETLLLTKEFGFFVGAYLAEGMSNSTQICITNNDPIYLANVKSLMDEWNLGTHLVSEDRECEKTNIKGHTTSLIIHSTLLARIMGILFGKVSYEKTLPDWVLQAPDEFVKGLVDGYISGDGTVDAKSGTVLATSVSKDLLVRFMALLARYGIFSTIHSHMPELKNFKSVSRSYTIRLPIMYSKIFAENFTLCLKAKQDKLEHHFIYNDTQRDCRRSNLKNTVFDRVKTIKEISPMGKWVYDLTVENTRNFTTLLMTCQKDTFHLAGVASKSNVTRGVPRLKELLKVTQNPKAISLTIPLKKQFRDSIDKAREVAQDLELTLLKDIVTKTAIYFDPTETTVIKEDKEILDFFNLFETQKNEEKWSKWLLRLEFDHDAMFNKNISMDDVAFALEQKFNNEINMVYSDHNSKKLIMRIRLQQADIKDKNDDILNLKKSTNRFLNLIIIRGIQGIKSVSYRKDTNYYELVNGKYEQITQYILDTDGSNFLEIMNHPFVYGNGVLSSHVHDIYENLGIEAARATLLNEITNLFADAGGVDFRHLGLLCDWMTRVGKLLSVDRYGINKQDIGPLAKASFEETEKILLKAALFGEVDPITGVSANIMTGQPIRGGTGFSEILLDEAALMRLQEGLPPVETEEEEFVPTQENIEEELYENPTDKCSAVNLKLNVALPQGKTMNEEPDVELTLLDE